MFIFASPVMEEIAAIVALHADPGWIAACSRWLREERALPPEPVPKRGMHPGVGASGYA
jgi:hypothetical protein